MVEKVDWSRRLDDPIPMPDGSTIRTVGEAAEYATKKLPRKIGNTPPWQRAAGDLAMASEHPAYVFLARISFYVAVHGETQPLIGNPKGKKANALEILACAGFYLAHRGIKLAAQ
jgi:hypothetical protein